MVGEEEDEGEGGAPARAAAVRLPSVLVLGRARIAGAWRRKSWGSGPCPWYRFGGFREISYLPTSECFPTRFARARVGSELGL